MWKSSRRCEGRADLKVRSKGGERVYDDRLGNPGKNVTLVGAMSDEGLIADMTLPGGLNTPSFLVYLKKILLPQLWVFAIVVIDNVRIQVKKDLSIKSW